MKKRMGLAASYSKHEDDSRISELPDEVLVSVLSLLTITEAARTSVLSHRWKKLWTFFNGSLNFDVTKRLFGVPEKFWPREMSKYLALMNQVLHMLVGSSTLDDFTVRFGSLDKCSKCHIDRCVEFAMGKRIQRLELDMNPIELASSGVPSYNFPNEFYAWIKQPCGLYIISALTSLTLNHISVSGEFIEFFLSNCPLLERLCVVDSQHLSKLKVISAAARKLKYLEISHCYRVESVEISAPNLLSFTYIGNVIQLHVENAPQLVEVSVGHDVIPYLSSSLSSYLSEIETLKLDFELEVNKEFTQFLALNKLKHLILRVDISNEGSLLGWTSLIEASPCLRKFTLEADTTKSKCRRKVQKVTAKHPHQCLKVVELVGFTGCASDIELAMYFLANATTLEQIIIDRRGPLVRGTPFEFEEVNLEETKKRGMQLKKYLPPGVDFVLI